MESSSASASASASSSSASAASSSAPSSSAGTNHNLQQKPVDVFDLMRNPQTSVSSLMHIFNAIKAIIIQKSQHEKYVSIESRKNDIYCREAARRIQAGTSVPTGYVRIYSNAVVPVAEKNVVALYYTREGKRLASSTTTQRPPVQIPALSRKRKVSRCTNHNLHKKARTAATWRDSSLPSAATRRDSSFPSAAAIANLRVIIPPPPLPVQAAAAGLQSPLNNSQTKITSPFPNVSDINNAVQMRDAIDLANLTRGC